VPIQHFGASPDRPLSPAVRAGDWLFVSGQASADASTGAMTSGTALDPHGNLNPGKVLDGPEPR
jgi:enamine deaminase RidA (YjgF/YER057c/UK114 family)